jgi:hypothetical protein
VGWRDSIAPEARQKFNTTFARTAPTWLKRRMGHPLASPIDLSRAEVLREADLTTLRDARALEQLLPELGLNDEAPELFPPDLRRDLGRGLRFWQYPSQLAPYLVLASGLGVRRYLEIGVQHGGTFVVTVEYLARFGPIERAVAADILDVPDLRRYGRLRPGARLVRRDSGTAAFRRLVEREGPWDLVLIDGDHSREAVRRDWETVRPHARAIAFHDVVDAWCPGVRETWREIRSEYAGEYSFQEFTAQYDEVGARTGDTHLGLGIAIRRAGPPVSPGG